MELVSTLFTSCLLVLKTYQNIGTDATIAEHISKIVEREYAMKRKEGRIEYLVPSTLGIGLVEGYNSIGFEKSLTKPHLRRQVSCFPFRSNSFRSKN
jgi:DNA topoisomerase-3